jgi:peptidoglycan/xylan/chitin deacetylase (PgdA/CDA1 family)
VFALTYDDGPGAYTKALLDILDQKGVKATFFVSGSNYQVITAGNNPDLIRRMYNSGHHIGSHSYSHADLTTLSVDGIWYEVNQLSVIFKSIIGVSPVFVRPPYGAWNDQVLTALGTWGYKVAWINLDTEDWKNPTSPQTSLNRVNAAMGATSSSYSNFIVLAHESIQGTVEEFTAKAIDSIRAKGYQLVTFGDCVGAPRSTWYRS